MDEGQAMEVDHDDVVAIMKECETRLKRERETYMYCGTSIDLYEFSNKKTRGWKHGHIFRANNLNDLSFDEGVLGGIKALDSIVSREACFLVHKPNEQEDIQDMMVRSIRLKHTGILKPYIAGFNSEISQVVSGFSKPSSSLADWLRHKLPVQNSYIPIEVQQLIRTAYLAIELIWREGSTSDDLAKIGSYYMIDNHVKINPLCTRERRSDENDKIPLRRAFGQMIEANIFTIWKDGELLDFIQLLGNKEARNTKDILEQPVLLSPARRELMYHKFDKTTIELTVCQKSWLAANADPGADWKTRAEDKDSILKEIIEFQAEPDKRNQEAKNRQGAAGQEAAQGQQGAAARQQGAAAGQRGAAAGQRGAAARQRGAAAGQRGAAAGQRWAAGQQGAAAGQQGAAGQEAAARQVGAAGKEAMGFTTDFFGALHFASVTTAHYLRHYKAKEGDWREGIKGRVDLLLKEVLPRLLSRRYNVQYIKEKPKGK